MKKIILITIILATLATLQGFTQIRTDLKKHFAYGAAISGGTYTVSYLITEDKLTSSLIAFGATAAIGAGKELIYDKLMNKGTPEWKDFGATVLGGIPVIVTLKLTIPDRRIKSGHRRLHKKKNKP